MKRLFLALFALPLVFSSCSEEESGCATCTTVTSVDGVTDSDMTIVAEYCDDNLDYIDGQVVVNGPMVVTTTCE